MNCLLSLTAPNVAVLGVILASSLVPPPPPEVLVQTVQPEDVPIYIDAVGTIDGVINAEIRARVPGYVREQAYRDGAFVKKGDLLYEIDPRPYQNMLEAAKAQGKAAEAALEHAKSEYTRTKSLVAAGNAASLRAFLAAGFVPVGAEALLSTSRE